MPISSEFLAALELAASKVPGPKTYPWPSPRMPGGFVTFKGYAEWQSVILGFRLRDGVPFNMTDLFNRALKLYLVAWIDFDLVTAAEMAALAALEHSLRDCYLRHFEQRHLQKTVARAKKENRPPRLDENFRPESISLATLLKHMHERDGLSDDQLPCVHKYGGKVIDLVTGERKPSLAAMRNFRMHGSPLNSGYQSGLLEVVRDLIEYAYRESILCAKSFVWYPHEPHVLPDSLGPELPFLKI